MKVLVTIANGFVGLAMLLRLNGMNCVTAIGSLRRAAMAADYGAQLVTVGELSA
jgi:hypothetical protein